MASFKVRRLLLSTGGARTGDSSNYTNIDTAGRLTMAGTGRVYREMWLPSTSFFLVGASSACGAAGVENVAYTGSMASASIVFNVSSSIFGGSSGGEQTGASVVVPVLTPAAALDASPTHVCTTFGKPLDADTTGSIQCRVVWTSSDMGTTGSVYRIVGGLTYLSSSAAARTAASVGANAAYNYTAGCIVHETNLGDLPSFDADDVAAVLTLMHRGDHSANTGGSAIQFLGVKLRYVANSLGIVTS